MTTIGRAETGERDITAAAVLKIIAGYQITPARFFGPAPKLEQGRTRRGPRRKIPAAVAKRAGLSA